MASLLYERVAKSREKEKVLALAKEGQRGTEPQHPQPSAAQSQVLTDRLIRLMGFVPKKAV